VAIEAERDRDGESPSRPQAVGAGGELPPSAGGPWLRHAVPVATVLLVAVGGLVRVLNALGHHGVIYPDETFQMTEAAHRVVFGYGIVPWEFQDGLRSWIGPGFLLPPTVVWRLLGLGGLTGMMLVKAWVALWATVGVGAAAVAARRFAGPWAGLLAAGLAALSPLAVVYEVHPLADTVAAPLPVLALALLAAPAAGHRLAATSAAAGVLLVAAVALRPQLALLAIGLAAAAVIGRARSRTLGLGAGLAAGVVLTGVLDLATWGVPFGPEWRSLSFNVVQGGADYYWGTSPATFYLAHALTVLGPVIVVLVGLGLVLAVLPGQPGALPSWPVTISVLALVGVLSGIGHKELRFVVPVLPLAAAMAAVGLTRGAGLLSRWHRAPAPGLVVALTVIAVIAGALGLRAITMRELGYRNDDRSAWTIDDTTPRLLARAGTLPGTCGVALLSEYIQASGGYSYLHRDVPLATVRSNPDVGDWRGWANTVVTSSASLPAGYHVVVRIPGGVVAQRGGPCAPPPPAVQSRILPAPTHPVPGMV
jgi:GPI mannosyltransferase 3